MSGCILYRTHPASGAGEYEKILLITTKNGVVYNFDAEDIVKGSGYISSQCCGSTEIELGTVYSAEMGITMLSDIYRYTQEDALVELTYHLRISRSQDSADLV